MHTPGPLESCTYHGVELPVGSYEAVDTLHDDQVAIAGPISDPSSVDTARLLAAAYTSYDRHFGERAVEAAESDVLGELVAFVRECCFRLDVRPGMREKARALMAKVEGE